VCKIRPAPTGPRAALSERVDGVTRSGKHLPISWGSSGKPPGGSPVHHVEDGSEHVGQAGLLYREVTASPQHQEAGRSLSPGQDPNAQLDRRSCVPAGMEQGERGRDLLGRSVPVAQIGSEEAQRDLRAAAERICGAQPRQPAVAAHPRQVGHGVHRDHRSCQ